MAMNVKSETYRTEDGDYAVTVHVTHEPKAGTYRVQFIVNEIETEVAYFTDRKTALIYANSGLSDLWFNPITPVPLIAPAMPDTLDLGFLRDDEPLDLNDAVHLHRYDEDGICACGVSMDPGEDDDGELDPERGTFVDRYGRPYEDRYEDPREFGHLSSDPAKCGCGDCLTYLAGQ